MPGTQFNLGIPYLSGVQLQNGKSETKCEDSKLCLDYLRVTKETPSSDRKYRLLMEKEIQKPQNQKNKGGKKTNA